eukprot:TRINITY_DN5129_c0_g1_i2.p1 TRINITY_DN5129_c0_g1~~TRINITY_DN5129_c0_g1_i2.p1  ORF type:complete len:126 (+),score=17.07 TRINITY_DN5129_c0_g1_i2:206-583(+)
MLNNNLINTGAAGNDYCSSSGTDFPLNKFASLANSQPSDDGAAVATICAATEYANVNPLGGCCAARDAIRTIPAGYTVAWRYVTLDGQFAMVRDPNVADGQRSEERFSRNAETDLVCRLLLEKKK